MVDSPTAAEGRASTHFVDSEVPQTARIWNYLLGGKDNYAVDRAVGDQIKEGTPELVQNARLSRKYLSRAVHYLAADAGIRQFLDLGTGLPTVDNTHEVAQRAAPTARIVYVDNDPLVLVHARALLTSSPEGATDYVDADLRDTESVLAQAARTIDFDQPVALLLMGTLGHIETDEEAKGIIDTIMSRLAPGSYFAMYDGSDTSEVVRESARLWNISANPKYHLRSPERMAALFDGLELVEPGVVSVTQWRPEPGASVEIVDQYCGMGRKPLT